MNDINIVVTNTASQENVEQDKLSPKLSTLLTDKAECASAAKIEYTSADMVV